MHKPFLGLLEVSVNGLQRAGWRGGVEMAVEANLVMLWFDTSFFLRLRLAIRSSRCFGLKFRQRQVASLIMV